jgi:hypothetical protein
MKKRIVPCLAGIASILLIAGCSKQSGQSDAQVPGVWTSSQAAAADSVEGQLRASGKKWVKTSGEIKAGDYVRDVLEGRLGQPEGRGAIAKVISVSKGNNGQLVALLDFGHGYQVGIQESELSLVSVQ